MQQCEATGSVIAACCHQLNVYLKDTTGIMFEHCNLRRKYRVSLLITSLGHLPQFEVTVAGYKQQFQITIAGYKHMLSSCPLHTCPAFPLHCIFPSLNPQHNLNAHILCILYPLYTLSHKCPPDTTHTSFLDVSWTRMNPTHAQRKWIMQSVLPATTPSNHQRKAVDVLLHAT